MTPTRTAELLHPLTSFIGREREVADVANLLRRPGVRLVTLTGPGGVGKTRLAIRVAEGLAADFPDGVWFAALASVRDPDLVVATLAQVLDVRESGERPTLERVTELLATKRALIVLDNFEHLLPAGPVLTHILAACPAVTMLVTSRSALRLSPEHNVVVPPLSLPRPRAAEPAAPIRQPSLPDAVPVRELASSEATRLFVERAKAADAAFSLTAVNAADVAALCVRLDGLPLAIELAAARLPAFSVSTLLARLDQRLLLLSDGPRDQIPRLRSMTDAIAWSHDLLTNEERIVFRRLSVFVGGFTLEAAQAVAADGSSGASGSLHLLQILASLVEQSLVQKSESVSGQSRYRLLETIREFGLERLAESCDDELVHARHAGYFAQFAELTSKPLWEDPDQAQTISHVDAEQGNLRAALAWAERRGDPALLLRLAMALRPYWHLRGLLGEGRFWLDRALELCTDASSPLRATALALAGWFARFQGDLNRAEALVTEAEARFREQGDVEGLVDALRTLGFIAEDQGNFARSLALREESLQLLLPLNQRFWIAQALRLVGVSLFRCGDLEPAEQRATEALALFRADGNRFGEALALGDLGNIAIQRGDYALAAARWRAQLNLPWNAWNFRYALEAFALIALHAGAAGQAAKLLGAAESYRERLGAPLVPGALPEHERTVAAAGARLGEDAFRAAWDEGRQWSADTARLQALRVADALTKPPELTVTGPPAWHGLTPREVDVARLVAKGMSNAEIAGALSISLFTAKRHVANILSKLDLPSRSALNTLMHEQGLVLTPDST